MADVHQGQLLPEALLRGVQPRGGRRVHATTSTPSSPRRTSRTRTSRLSGRRPVGDASGLMCSYNAVRRK